MLMNLLGLLMVLATALLVLLEELVGRLGRSRVPSRLWKLTRSLLIRRPWVSRLRITLGPLATRLLMFSLSTRAVIPLWLTA